MIFTKEELFFLENHSPEVLRILANNYHEVEITKTIPMLPIGDRTVINHTVRKYELLTYADKIEADQCL